MRSIKKTSKKNIAGKIFFISRNKLVFFSKCFFLSPGMDCFFPKIGNNLMRTLGRKKHMFCFFGNALPKSNERAHLKQRKKI